MAKFFFFDPDEKSDDKQLRNYRGSFVNLDAITNIEITKEGDFADGYDGDEDDLIDTDYNRLDRKEKDVFASNGFRIWLSGSSIHDVCDYAIEGPEAVRFQKFFEENRMT